VPALPQATRISLGDQAKNVDFTKASFTRPVQTGSALPATCTQGDLYFRTDAVAGQNLYACTATNTWTLQSGGSMEIATETEATNGVDNLKVMTPLRTAQSIMTLCALPNSSGQLGSVLATDGSTASWTRHLTLPAAAAQSVTTENTAIAASRYYVQVSPNNNYTLISTPTIALGDDGQFLVITNLSTTYSLTLQDEAVLANTRLRLGGANATIGPRGSLTLVYSNALGAWVRTTDSPAPASPSSLPDMAGNAGRILKTDGTSASWATLTTYQTFPAGNCQIGVASTGYALPSSNFAGTYCLNSGSTVQGLLAFSDAAADESAQIRFPLPPDWTGSILLDLRWTQSGTDTGNVKWSVQGVCAGAGQDAANPAFSTPLSWTSAALGAAWQLNDTAQQPLTTADVLSGCSAGKELYLKFSRASSDAGDTFDGATAYLVWARVRISRAQ
jgi:hypothetical protein